MMSGAGRRRRNGTESAGTLQKVWKFMRMAEFEILFVLFFVVAFIIFKDLTSRPEYNQILVKKHGGDDVWPF